MIEVLIPIAETITYSLFAFLCGYVALRFVPESKKPSFSVPLPALLLATLGIILFSLGSIIQVVLYFSDSVGFLQTTLSVFTDFQVGKAWVFTSMCATFLWMAIHANASKHLQAILLLGMVCGVGYASHVASLDFWAGFISHTTHFLLIMVWAGILIHVSFFSRNLKNWSQFLKWFTPYSIISLLIIFGSGIFITSYLVDGQGYINAWSLSYGQTLLLKHISIIPLIIFAFINGWLVKKSAQSEFDPKPWLKAEGVFILIVFSLTSVLGTLSPPHDVDVTLLSEGPAPILESLLNENISTPVQAIIDVSFTGILVLSMAGFFILMIFASFYKKLPILVPIFFGLAFICALYVGLMLNLSFS
ncbi:copper resistance D family protein [Jeotgalibacillus terrae]|uniref:Copper resistance D family protein n=1 Tax=Jeotgalibacillus terrae TaxID=587735 RepID=A0ABW5ZJB3_9BACL|nr:CopD family protein [Jeotgalibacillus terrae]MBM7578517.1 putative copper resistance protein D [Jeotgalibacillus terrae]